MAHPIQEPDPETEAIPLGQRLFDSPFLLLAAGVAIMVALYTGWGLWEIMNMTVAPLP